MVYAAYLFSGSSGPLTNPNRPDESHQHDSLPEGAVIALADGSYLAWYEDGAPQFEQQSEPLDIDRFLDAAYNRPDAHIANHPHIVVSAPELNTVYAAKLSASGRISSYGTAFYQFRETGDGWFRWSEVTDPELRSLEGAGDTEEFRNIVSQLNDEAARRREAGETSPRLAKEPPSESADQALLAAALGGRTATSLIDRQQHPPEAPQAAAATPDVAVERAVTEGEFWDLRSIDPDQGFFSSARRIPTNSRSNWQFESASAVYATTDRVAASLRQGQWTTHDVDRKWAMTTVSSVRNALTSDPDFGSRDRDFEDRILTVQGDAGLAVRRIDLDSGTIVQLFQPNGETDPETGVPQGEWVDFPVENPQYTNDRYLTRWQRWLTHETNLKSRENTDNWVNGARNFLAGGLQEDGTRANDGYEALLGLAPLPDEARQASLGQVLQAPEAVIRIRWENPAQPENPALPRWADAIRQARLAREAAEIARRTAARQPQQPQYVWWNTGGGPGM